MGIHIPIYSPLPADTIPKAQVGSELEWAVAVLSTEWESGRAKCPSHRVLMVEKPCL